jgi:hypothetical protein
MYKISHSRSVPRPLRGWFASYESARQALRSYWRKRGLSWGKDHVTMEVFNVLGFKIRRV